METLRSNLSSLAASVAARSFEIMASGTLQDFQDVVHPDAINRESRSEPLAARGRGPEAFHASAVWLRSAYEDLEWVTEQQVVEDDVVATHMTMSGRHTGPFVVFGDDGKVDHVFAPTGKEFRVTQSHWIRVKDSMVVEHWANRDDLGQSFQLGWVPPTPLYLLRCAIAKRKALRLTSREAASRSRLKTA